MWAEQKLISLPWNVQSLETVTALLAEGWVIQPGTVVAGQGGDRVFYLFMALGKSPEQLADGVLSSLKL